MGLGSEDRRPAALPVVLQTSVGAEPGVLQEPLRHHVDPGVDHVAPAVALTQLEGAQVMAEVPLQSIFSHTQRGLAAKCLNNIPYVLDDSGLVACTFLLPHQVEKKDLNVLGDSWVYPGCVGFSEEMIHQLFDAVGLHAWKLNWFHPRQTWYVASKNPDASKK